MIESNGPNRSIGLKTFILRQSILFSFRNQSYEFKANLGGQSKENNDSVKVFGTVI